MKNGHTLTPIEIKASQAFHPDFLKGLRYFQDLTDEQSKNRYLIYAGDREQQIQNIQIKHFSNIHTIEPNLNQET